jgi:AraC-like DNA-binding protein
MDLLTDILQDAGLRRRRLALRELPDEVLLRFPCAKSIGLHVVVQGPVHVHAPTLDTPLALTTGLIEEEFRRDEAGADTIVHALLDVVFTYALREIATQRGVSQAGWSHAVRDAQVRRALTLMHEDCAHAWTLEELAQRAGLSRTGLAERFRDAMGDTPLNHLRTLRMQRAMKLLAESERNLEAVAAEVGYQDAFSFSKVFKRTVGVSPKAFRQRDAADRAHPWRFGGA